jgi:hypothetical protein
MHNQTSPRNSKQRSITLSTGQPSPCPLREAACRAIQVVPARVLAVGAAGGVVVHARLGAEKEPANHTARTPSLPPPPPRGFEPVCGSQQGRCLCRAASWSAICIVTTWLGCKHGRGLAPRTPRPGRRRSPAAPRTSRPRPAPRLRRRPSPPAPPPPAHVCTPPRQQLGCSVDDLAVRAHVQVAAGFQHEAATSCRNKPLLAFAIRLTVIVSKRATKRLLLLRAHVSGGVGKCRQGSSSSRRDSPCDRTAAAMGRTFRTRSPFSTKDEGSTPRSCAAVSNHRVTGRLHEAQASTGNRSSLDRAKPGGHA